MAYIKSFKAWIVFVFALYSFLGFIALPWFLTNKASIILQDKSGLHVSISDASFNPFTFELTLKEFVVYDLQNNPVFKTQNIYLNYTPLALLDHSVFIKELTIFKPEVFIVLQSDGSLNVANILPPSQTMQQEQSEQESGLLFVLDTFAMQEGMIHFRDQKKNFTLDLGAYDFLAHDIKSDPNALNSHQFYTQIANGGILEWNGGMRINPLRLHGTITINDLSLSSYWDYLASFMPAKLHNAKASFVLPYQINLENGLHVALNDAELSLANIDFFHEDKQIISVTDIQAQGVNLAYPEQDIVVKSVQIENPKLQVLLDKDGLINLQKAFEIAQNPTPQQNTQATKPWQYLVKKIAMNGGNIDLLDNFIATNSHFSFDNVGILLQDFSSDQTAAFSYTLATAINQHTTLKLDGNLTQMPFTMQSNMALQDLHVKDFANYIAPFTSVHIKDGKLQADAHIWTQIDDGLHVSVQTDTQLQDLSLLASDETQLLSWKNLILKNLAFSTTTPSLHVQSIELEEPFVRINIDKSGETNFANLLSERPQDNTQKENTQKQMQIKIGPMKIINAKADFSDENIPFPFRTNIHDLQGGLSVLDFQESTPAKLDIKGKVDTYGYAQIKGILIPLDIKKQADIAVTFKNIDLRTITPYSTKFLGYKIKNGKLSMDLAYTIKGANLKGENKLNIDSLTLGEKVDIQGATNLPLHLAIALLKDSNNQIDIDLPVSGDMNNPEFSYGSIVWRAFGNLITGIVTAPFRFLGNMLGVDGEKLKSIDFALAQSDILNSEQEKLQNIAKILAKRPNIKLNIVGTFEPQLDMQALREQALRANIMDEQILLKKQIKDPKIDTYALALKNLYLQNFALKKYEELQATFRDEKTKNLNTPAFNKVLEKQLATLIIIPKETLIKLADSRALNIKNLLINTLKADVKRVEIAPSIPTQATRDSWIEVQLDIKN
ncbi:MAG: DUF748 domain-containing protein [Sulfurospirillum sp.]|nr:DUF748 domain-containing protein [Sulfurospirillum sp.]